MINTVSFAESFEDGQAPHMPSYSSRIAGPQPLRSPRAVVLAVGVAIHAGLLLALLNARLDVSVPAQQPTVWTNLLPMSPPAAASPTSSRIRAVQPRSIPVPARPIAIAKPQSANSWVATSPASAASAPLPTEASSAPLRLTLTPSELRTIEAGTPPTLAQRLMPPAASPLLAQRLAPTPQFEEDDRSGIHTVRSHGGCYILVPSGQAQADPFNHGGQRVTGRATNDNC